METECVLVKKWLIWTQKFNAYDMFDAVLWWMHNVCLKKDGLAWVYCAWTVPSKYKVAIFCGNPHRKANI